MRDLEKAQALIDSDTPDEIIALHSNLSVSTIKGVRQRGQLQNESEAIISGLAIALEQVYANQTITDYPGYEKFAHDLEKSFDRVSEIEPIMRDVFSLIAED